MNVGGPGVKPMSQMKTSLEHLKHHVPYPTDKKGVVAACNNMSDVEAADREWFSKTLPEGQYKGAEDVMRAMIAKV
jgi:hypothetical protein